MMSPNSLLMTLLMLPSVSTLVLSRSTFLTSLSTSLTSIVLPSQTPCDPQNSTPYCIGVIDGLLADCPTNKCVSTQDDRPAVFANPWTWDYHLPDDTGAPILDRLRSAIELRADYSVTLDYDPPYARFSFGDGTEVEFYKTPSDDTMQFRSNGPGGNGRQRRRLEEIRIAMGMENLPVLRNRKRRLLFVESPLDDFGPATGRDPTYDIEAGTSGWVKDYDPASPDFNPGPRYGNGKGLVSEFKRLVISESDDRVLSK